MRFFSLKPAALLSMLFDHVARIAAPIFLFSIAKGYRHTRALKRYALGLPAG